MSSLTRRVPRVAGLGVVLAVASLVIATLIGSTAASNANRNTPSELTTSQYPPTTGEGGPTKGAIPPEAFELNGINVTLAPDYVEALGQEGEVVGYIPKRYFDKQYQSGKEALPVYGDDLTTLVGYHLAGKGFVTLGTDPDGAASTEVKVEPSP